jgi:hypothetical protein
MRRLRFTIALAVTALPSATAALLTACGDTVVVPPEGDGGGGLGGGGTGLVPSGPSSSSGFDAGSDATSDYVDPGCPDPLPPIYDFVCDPYAQGNGDCAVGEGCYIFVQYPAAPCGQEIYGAYCLPVGSGQQGDPCAGAGDCGSGHVCVVTGLGTQCVELCPLEGPSGCPAGLVCEPIDVEGFGGCL